MGVWTALLPLAAELPERRARRYRALAGIVLGAVAASLVLAFVAGAEGASSGLASLGVLVGTIVTFARAVHFREERAAWACVGSALGLAFLSGVYLAIAYGDGPQPVPSPGDALGLAAYPLAYVASLLLLRARAERCPASVWLDGGIGALSVAAVGSVFVFEPLLDRDLGSTAAVVTNLAYPVGDVVLLGLVVGSLALTGWQLGRGWTLLGLAFVAIAVADITYIFSTSDAGAQPPAITLALLAVPGPLAALAAWERPGRAVARAFGWPVMVLPALWSLVALALLVYGNLAHIGIGATLLAAGAVVAGVVRTFLTLREVRALAESHRQALTDDLTGLPNRRAFQRRLDELTGEATAGGQPLALAMIDLDGFKELNDTLGHQAGDLVLAQLGERLAAVLRPGHFLARLGGDEFAVLMPGADSAATALSFSEDLLAVVRKSFTLAEMPVRVDASAGIALVGEDGATGDMLLRQADVAMYQAKSERSGSHLYDSERDQHSRDRLQLTGELRDAIAHDELILHFQPKLSMRTGEPVGVEALVRWQHPERGLVPPGEFIPLAEQTGLMRRLTERVLRQAVYAGRRWRDGGHDLTVAVNVAATNLLDEDFPAVVAELLDVSGLDPSRLVLEITEESVMSDTERGKAVLGDLRALGVALSLDDFGTGYSSLSYLARLPVHELKIDRSFVIGALDRTNDLIVSSVADLARNLGLRLVAEGIEDAATWDRMRAHGCDEAQGFYMSRPLPEDELSEWLEQRSRAVREPGADPGMYVLPADQTAAQS